MHIRRKSVLPIFYHFGQSRLCDAESHHCLVMYVCKAVMFSDIFYYVPECSYGLKRNSGKRIQCRWVSELFLSETEDHHGGCTHTVDDHLAPVRYGCLSPVDVKHIQASCLQNPVHDFKLTLVLHISAAAGQFSKSGFCYVVFCRAEPSCDNHDVICPEFGCEVVYYLIPVITDGQHPGHFDSCTSKGF